MSRGRRRVLLTKFLDRRPRPETLSAKYANPIYQSQDWDGALNGFLPGSRPRAAGSLDAVLGAGYTDGNPRLCREHLSPYRRHGTRLSLCLLPYLAQIDCMIKALPQTTCAPTNQTCLCADTKFSDAVTPCIVASCTVKEALAVANTSVTQCERPATDQTAVIHWVSGIATVLSTVFVAMRLVSRAAKLGAWGNDDTAVMVAFLMLVVEIMYVFAIAAAKSSILFFYCRIFPDKRFCNAVWAVQIFNALVALAFLIVFCAQCQPFSYFWSQWDGEHHGKCIDFGTAGLVHLALQVAIDLAILVLPITQIYSLQMDARRKAGVMAMFLTGIFVTIVTCLRIQGLAQDSKWLNVSGEFLSCDCSRTRCQRHFLIAYRKVAALGPIILTHVEASVCITVACMPNGWQLFKIFSSHVVKMSTTLVSKKGSLASNNQASALGRELEDRPLKSPATESTAFPEESVHSPLRV
ncbi:CFEM domain-containing protein (integral membrane protein) [Colletotrichum sojae]|uniref:CFEM domain-containing protein (Integral membrane protein) n=1 Tax=Colletotrichum sojae TaxID=2175907 RepID=A0A8H6JHC5_9PEZI|nr:CFEM domain-containing protein (integral membrane protein) [Colletotrichum sojae]